MRIVVISAVLPVAGPVIAHLREMGHDVVAWLTPRRPQAKDRPPPAWGEISDRTAPHGVNLLMARDKADIAPLLRGLQPDVVLCWGFPWKIPEAALELARYGFVNQHPAPLPGLRPEFHHRPAYRFGLILGVHLAEGARPSFRV